MPFIFEKEQIITKVKTGLQCDKCDEIKDPLTNNFQVNYSGYDSKHDMTNIQFVLCDNCLYDFAASLKTAQIERY